MVRSEVQLEEGPRTTSASRYWRSGRCSASPSRSFMRSFSRTASCPAMASCSSSATRWRRASFSAASWS